MKKFMYIFAFPLLLAVFAGCNDSDDGPIAPGIQPVSPDAKLTAFFNENLSIIAHSIFNEYNEQGGRGPNFVDSCVMINSAEEFRQIDFINDPLELPAIDFDTYALVIGQYVTMESALYLASQGIVIEQNEILINTLIKRREGISQLVLNMKPFWGLYPKLPQMPIHVVRLNDY